VVSFPWRGNSWSGQLLQNMTKSSYNEIASTIKANKEKLVRRAEKDESSSKKPKREGAPQIPDSAKDAFVALNVVQFLGPEGLAHFGAANKHHRQCVCYEVARRKKLVVDYEEEVRPLIGVAGNEPTSYTKENVEKAQEVKEKARALITDKKTLERSPQIYGHPFLDELMKFELPKPLFRYGYHSQDIVDRSPLAMLPPCFYIPVKTEMDDGHYQSSMRAYTQKFKVVYLILKKGTKELVERAQREGYTDAEQAQFEAIRSRARFFVSCESYKNLLHDVKVLLECADWKLQSLLAPNPNLPRP